MITRISVTVEEEPRLHFTTEIHSYATFAPDVIRLVNGTLLIKVHRYDRPGNEFRYRRPIVHDQKLLPTTARPSPDSTRTPVRLSQDDIWRREGYIRVVDTYRSLPVDTLRYRRRRAELMLDRYATDAEILWRARTVLAWVNAELARRCPHLSVRPPNFSRNPPP